MRDSTADRPPWAWIAFAFAISLGVNFSFVFSTPLVEPKADALGYIVVGYKLAETGVFSGEDDYDRSKKVVPANFFAPIQPFVMSIFVLADAEARETFGCLNDRRGDCDLAPLWQIVIFQTLLASLTTSLIFAVAWEVFDAPVPAVLSLAIVLSTGTLAGYAATMLTETYAFLFFFAALWAGLRLVRSEELRWAVVAGLAVGFAALSRPSYLYPAYGAALGILLWQLWPGRANVGAALRLAGCFVGAAFLVLLPWMLRNYVQLGAFEVSGGYASFILVQRVAYNLMTWPEWLVAWIYWLPDFGDNLAASLFPPELWQRLSWDHPDGFYQTGQVMRQETIAAAGSPEAHMSMIVNDYLLPNIWWHFIVTLPVAMRGIWVGGILSGIAVLVALPSLPYFWREGRLWPLAVLAAPMLFMLGLHAFATVNVGRYNEPLVALYAIFVVGFALESLRFWAGRSVGWAARLYMLAHGRDPGRAAASAHAGSEPR